MTAEEELWELMQNEKTHVYMCGLKGGRHGPAWGLGFSLKQLQEAVYSFYTSYITLAWPLIQGPFFGSHQEVSRVHKPHNHFLHSLLTILGLYWGMLRLYWGYIRVILGSRQDILEGMESGMAECFGPIAEKHGKEAGAVEIPDAREYPESIFPQLNIQTYYQPENRYPQPNIPTYYLILGLDPKLYQGFVL